MKRDMDLIRQIMLEIEQISYNGGWFRMIEGHNEEEVSYHVMQLADAGLIKAEKLPDSGSMEWLPAGLTWQGHEFLDAARNETIWQKAKKYIQDKDGALTFDVIRAVLAQIALKQVGL